jgi:predicted metal-dependent peptidase
MATMKPDLPAEKRIERAHAQLMKHPDFCLFSGVFMIGKVSISDTHPTACTNGRDVVYGRAFVDSLDDKQLAFVVVHEAMHKAYRHLTVWKNIAKENPQLANAAMDYVINLQIVDSDRSGRVVTMPRDADGKLLGLLDEKYRDMDTKQVYQLLKKEMDEGGEGGNGGDGNGNGQPDNPSGSRSGQGQPQNGNGDGDSQGFDEHDWDGARDLSAEEEEALTREVDSALREGAILAGKMKGKVHRGIDELLHPKVDWREALREFVKTHTRGGDQSTWRRPNRRYLGIDIVMPSAVSQKAELFVLGVDTSGSIGGSMLTQFMSEINSICEEVAPETVELLYWDSHVAGRETYHGAEVEQLINTTKPRGGGGTTPECVPIFLEAERIAPQCVIMLTDGEFYGDGWHEWNRISAPVLWCVVGNKNFVPKYGQSVYVG